MSPAAAGTRSNPGTRWPRTPAPANPLPDALLDGIVQRAARPDYPRFEDQLHSSNYCARPIRLTGRVERYDALGHRTVWSTANEPDGILRKACGNRREAVCPSCAERYRGDAYHLIGAGLRGGKGVPDTVTDHPMLFVTLTAPSFGAVHTRALARDGKPRRCRPRRDTPACPHGVRLCCNKTHAEDDPQLGEPICPDCFDHAGAVVWNNLLGELWRRTTIYLPRALARQAGMTHKQLKAQARFSYIKVAEYQRRGLVHFHVIVRLDRAMPKYRADEIRPPASRFDVQALEDAVRAAVADVQAPLPGALGPGSVRWGRELDVRPITEPGRMAGYLAKYATKSTEQAGGLPHRVSEDSLDALPVRDHPRNLMREAFELAHDPDLADRRLGRNAHQFGYRGHCLTKSRRYSTTFKELRQAREEYVHEQLRERSSDASQRAIATAVVRATSFRYVGIGPSHSCRRLSGRFGGRASARTPHGGSRSARARTTRRGNDGRGQR